MVIPELANDVLVKLHLKKIKKEDNGECNELAINENCMPASNSLLESVLSENKEIMKELFLSNGRIARISAVLWYSRKANRIPLLILTSFRLFIVAFFIVSAVHQFLTENTKVIFFLLIASVFLIMQSKWLLNQYLKMENQFLDNLKGEKEDMAE